MIFPLTPTNGQQITIGNVVYQYNSTKQVWDRVGSTSPAGYTGSRGTTGFVGSVGFVGSAGVAGFDGSQGNIGFAGSSGFTGSSGVAGGVTYAVTNSGASSYIIAGSSNPTLTLIKGFTYYFTVSAAGHPFWIKTAQVTNTGSAYTSGVTNNGVDSGTVSFTVPYDAPATLYYICQFHSSMTGTLTIANSMVGFAGSAGTGFTGSAGVGFAGSAGTGFTGSAGIGFTGSAGIGFTGSAGIGFTGSQGLIGYTGSAGTGGGGSANIIIQDEGSTLTSAVTAINFVGSRVTATNNGSTVTVTVSGGGTSVTAGNINGGTSLSSATTFTGSGSTTAYNFGGTILDATQLIVHIDGVYQIPNTNFSANSSWVIFDTAPAAGAEIVVQYATAGYTGIPTPLINQLFTANGSQTTFTLSDYVVATDILVTVDTVIQTPTTNYTINGLNLVFDTAPTANSTVTVRSFGNWSTRDGFVNLFTGNGAQTNFTMSGSAISSRSMMVFVDGIYQIPDIDFTIAGSQLTFVGAPDANSDIVVQSFNNTFGTNPVVADPAGIAVGNTAVLLDSFSSSMYRTAKYIISVDRGTEFQCTEAMLVHNGNTAQLVTYAIVYTGNAQIMSFSANVASNLVSFYGTGVSAGNTVKLQRTYVKV